MIPVFKRLDENAPIGQKELISHINAVQDEIFACLADITSANVTELSSDSTAITSERGSSFSGDKIELCGAKGERFSAGYDKSTGNFEFSLTDGSGNLVFYFDGAKLSVAS